MKSFITFIAFSLTLSLTAQSWLTVGSNPQNKVRGLYGDPASGGQLYIAENTNNSQIGMEKWNGTSYSQYSQNFLGGGVAIIRHGGQTYMGNGGSTAAPNGLKRWTGSSWITVGGNILNSASPTGVWTINSLCSFNGDLYMGGNFTSVNGVPARSIAKWDGTNWSSVDSGFYYSSGMATIYSLYVFNGELYAGGCFTSAGSGQIITNRVAKLSGGVWIAVDNGMVGTANNYAVRCMTEYNNELYAGGSMTDPIMKWNGSSWIAISTAAMQNTGVNTMCAFNGMLFAANSQIITYDGFVCSMPNDGNSNGVITSMAIYNNELYIGGDFTSIGSCTADYLAKYYMVSTSTVEYTTSQIRFYPNPAIDKITIESGQNNSIEIFNSQGQLVMQQQNTNTVNVTSLEAGCYTISIKTEESAKVSQFIKL